MSLVAVCVKGFLFTLSNKLRIIFTKLSRNILFFCSRRLSLFNSLTMSNVDAPGDLAV